MRSNRKVEGLSIVLARVRVFAFQMRHILRGRFEWQEEIYRESITPKGKPVITYVGVCRVPKGAHWPYDPRITRRQFYNRPHVHGLWAEDEHATQHY